MPDYLVEFDVTSTTRYTAVIEAESSSDATYKIAKSTGYCKVLKRNEKQSDVYVDGAKEIVNVEKVLNHDELVSALNSGYPIYNHLENCYYWMETIHDPVGGDKSIILCSGLPFGEHDIIDGVHRVWMCDLEGHDYILTAKEKK